MGGKKRHEIGIHVRTWDSRIRSADNTESPQSMSHFTVQFPTGTYCSTRTTREISCTYYNSTGKTSTTSNSRTAAPSVNRRAQHTTSSRPARPSPRHEPQNRYSYVRRTILKVLAVVRSTHSHYITRPVVLTAVKMLGKGGCSYQNVGVARTASGGVRNICYCGTSEVGQE